MNNQEEVNLQQVLAKERLKYVVTRTPGGQIDRVYRANLAKKGLGVCGSKTCTKPLQERIMLLSDMVNSGRECKTCKRAKNHAQYQRRKADERLS